MGLSAVTHFDVFLACRDVTMTEHAAKRMYRECLRESIRYRKLGMLKTRNEALHDAQAYRCILLELIAQR